MMTLLPTSSCGSCMTAATRLLAVAVLSLMASVAAAEADLAVFMSADRASVQPGASGLDLVNFTVTVENDGPDSAAVVVTDLLPTGLRIPPGMSAEPDQGLFDAVTGRWTVGFLAARQDASLRIPAQATAGATGCLVNEASAAFAVGSTTVDPDPDNNFVRLAVGAPACADLIVTTRRNNRVESSCADALHILRVTNRGPTPATDVTLQITRYQVIDPPGFSEPSCTTGSVIVPGPDTIELGTLAADQYEEFVTGLRDLSPDGPDIEVSYDIRAAATEPDPDTTDNRETGRYTILRPFDEEDDDDSDFLCIVSGALGGSGMERHLPELRRFRDRVLMNNRAGRAIVRGYYRASPPVAELMARHESLRTAVRLMLAPLIYGVLHPLMSAALMLATLLSILAFRARAPRIRRLA
jgi:uncharacterized repeat protein (TIGR01451 family)